MLLMDWDVGDDSGADISDYDAGRGLVYQYFTAGGAMHYMAGARLLNQTQHAYGGKDINLWAWDDTDMQNEINSPYNTVDPVTPVDQVIWLLASLPNIPIGGSETVSFALSASESNVDQATSLANLQAQIDRATAAYAPAGVAAIPTIGEWGMIILSLGMLIGATVILRRRQCVTHLA